MSYNTLGQRIKKLRLEQKISQLEFSKKMNISNTTLSMYESDKRIPSDDIKKRIADYFGISLDYLMGVSDMRNHPSSPNIELTVKDIKDIKKDIDSIRQELLKQRNGETSETLLFDGEPMCNEGIDQILAALEIGMEMVKKKNKAKYTPKKYQK